MELLLLGVVLAGALLVAAGPGHAPRDLPRLRVSDNHRYLVTEEGKPFFWLGDTAWFLRTLSPADVELYLSTRAAQGFTIIQVVLVSTCGLLDPDPPGLRPFLDDDADRPNEAFWRRIDALVATAHARGLYLALFPVWGHDFTGYLGGDPDKAYRFGRWLGQRHGDRRHVVWSVSGEYDAVNAYALPISELHRQVINAMARGLQEGHGGTQLMSIHPGAPRTSSLDFHRESWLDFNMLQTGHWDDAEAFGAAENHALIAHDYGLTPTKPVLDDESMYEDTPDGVWIARSLAGPRGGADAMRRKAYWAVFAGGFGHTYGHNDVWCFFVPTPGHALTPPGQRGHWKDALHAPGGVHMQHLRRLMESRPFLTRIPDQSVIVGDPGAGLRHLQATRDARGSYAMVYVPAAGQTVKIATNQLSGKALKAWWYDPRTGQAAALKGNFPVGGELEFAAPAEGPDWVLVLDDAAQRYPAPGRPYQP